MVPEFAARLGAAYGSMFPRGTVVTTNRDLSFAARMIKRALMAGLVSTGVDILDIGEVPVPVARYETRVSDAKGGLHVRVSPENASHIDVKVFGAGGLNIDKNVERKVESTFFREDYRRVTSSEVGEIITVGQPVVDRYTSAFLARVDRRPVAAGRLRAVVDYGLGSTSAILPTLLGELGAEAITVNAATGRKFNLRSPADEERDLQQLAAICHATGVHFGAMMDNDGKTISLVDDQGNVVGPVEALAAFAMLTWQVQPGSTVVVPLTAPHILESLAAKYGGRVRRVPVSAESQMRAAVAGAVDPALVGDAEGSYIFPDFHPGFDGMMAVARLLQYLGAVEQRLSEVLSRVPPFFVSSADAACPSDAKGRVMRVLHERATQESASERAGRGDGAGDEQIEGVRFGSDGEWAVILPDPDKPLFHIYAESASPEAARDLAGRYVQLVESLEADAGRPVATF
jgi:mannose-1-phosphate guanylyltransferase/phosphomannomutase